MLWNEEKKDLMTRWILIGILFLVAYIRYRLIDVPLERDEGEYAYAGRLILEGLAPYKHLYNMKLPGTYGMYALIMAIFGQTVVGIRLGLLIFSLLNTLLVFFLCKPFMRRSAALFATLSFGLLFLVNHLDGFYGKAEHFVVFFSVSALVVLTRGIHSDKKIIVAFIGGVLMGMSFLMKQHAIFFLMFGFIYICMESFFKKEFLSKKTFLALGAYSAGVFLPYIMTCLIFFWAGAFSEFWFYTFSYARSYVNQVTDTFWEYVTFEGIPGLKKEGWLWIFAILGLVGARIHYKINHRLFILLFFIFSFLCITPGLYFRKRYFLMFLPAFSLAAGVGFHTAMRIVEKWKIKKVGSAFVILVAILCLGGTFKPYTNMWFKYNPLQFIRYTYGMNPFPESEVIAHYIRKNSNPDDLVGVLGSEVQINFLADRKPASPFAYMFTFMEKHPYALTMQKTLMRQFEESEPEYVIFVNIFSSWAGTAYNTEVIQWFWNEFVDYYKPVGMVELFHGNYAGVPPKTFYFWEEQSHYTPVSKTWVGIYKKLKPGEKSPVNPRLHIYRDMQRDAEMKVEGIRL